jgi:hypothetical protein
LLEYTISGWTIKFTRTGEYLGLAGECGDGTDMALTAEPFYWDIWPDDVDPSKYRCGCQSSMKGLPYTSPSHRFFVYGTKYCFNTADYGNPNPGTAVILWSRHHDANQIWEMQESTYTSVLRFRLAF